MLVPAVPARTEETTTGGGHLRWLVLSSLLVITAASVWRIVTAAGSEPRAFADTPHLAKLAREQRRPNASRASPHPSGAAIQGLPAVGVPSGSQLSAEQQVASAGQQDDAGYERDQRVISTEGTPEDETLPGTPEDGSAAAGAEQHSYFVQVASLTSETAASSLAKALERLGFRAKTSPYGLSRGKWWHVVRIGPFGTRVEAERRRLDLAREQRHHAKVIPHARGPFFAQVASLLSRDRARSLANRLVHQGHHARAVTVSTPEGKRWHSVRIGPFDTRDEASAYRDLLSEPEREGTVIIPYEPRSSG